MNLPHYNYLTNDFRTYEFYSEGQNGRIKKVVIFSRARNNPPMYNLALLDVDPVSGLTSDITVSNNGDRDIILATVAYAVEDFSVHYGKYFIYAEGSTPVRTRLYQISIARLLEEISAEFEVYGVIDEIRHPFQRNVNYDAFLVKKK